MTQVRRVLVPVTVLALGAALAAAAVAQAPQGPRRGFGMGSSRGSLLGLLRIEQVQKELKLSEENVAKVTELREKLATEMREKFAALLRGYFDQGGMEVQFNVVDDATLRDAQVHPERYRDLVVRVSGYSAFFTDLGPAIQNELIARTGFGEY